MERLDGDRPAPPSLRGGVIALGNFDGFHLGHQAVVARAAAIARAEGRPLLIATFDPHPMRHFRPDTPPFHLTTLDQRQELFAAAGADAMAIFAFDAALAALTPERFVDRELVDRLGVAAVVTGEDFTFGARRAGSTATLRDLLAARGMTAATAPPVLLDDRIVSSTRIREALTASRPDAAARLLTRPFTIRGEVIHGAQLGRTLGFPTANIALGDYLRPAYGIYAVRGCLPDGRRLDGAANLGIRPTVAPVELLEPHFFDFHGDLYGQVIDVELISFLRPEAKYATLDDLTAQIARDCAAARETLAAG